MTRLDAQKVLCRWKSIIGSAENMHKAQRQREFLKLLDPVVQGNHIIAHFSQFLRAAINSGPRIGGQQLSQRGLRTFDAAGQHGLSLDERPYEQVRVGQPAAFAGKLAEPAVGV